MSSDSDKRNTRVEMDYLKRFQSLSPIPEPKELFTKGQTAVREVSRSPNHLAKALKRKRMGSPEDDTFNTEAGPLDLILPQATDAGIRSHEYVGIQNESPWQSLQKVYELKLDGFIYVAIRKSPSCELVTVKNFLGSDKDRKVKRLQQTQHENFVGFLEAFQSDGSVHVILEYIPISLAHIVKSPAYPTELQLAAILGQVNRLLLGKKTDAKKTQILAGLNFLASKSLEHGALTCSNVLVNGDGVIKIGRLEPNFSILADIEYSKPRVLPRHRPLACCRSRRCQSTGIHRHRIDAEIPYGRWSYRCGGLGPLAIRFQGSTIFVTDNVYHFHPGIEKGKVNRFPSRMG